MESGWVSEETKKQLRDLYQSLNPTKLKRKIDEKLRKLYKAYEEKNRESKVSPFKEQKPHVNTESYIFDDLITSTLVT